MKLKNEKNKRKNAIFEKEKKAALNDYEFKDKHFFKKYK